jgi:xanthine dehydrogenase accessory factor
VEEGFTEEELARIHGPVGLDLGGRDPAEIALAVLAEVLATRYGRSAVRRG